MHGYRHDIVGIVKEVGSNVCGFKVGDLVGVGFYVNSCRDCHFCNDVLEKLIVQRELFTLLTASILTLQLPKENDPTTLLSIKGNKYFYHVVSF